MPEVTWNGYRFLHTGGAFNFSMSAGWGGDAGRILVPFRRFEAATVGPDVYEWFRDMRPAGVQSYEATVERGVEEQVGPLAGIVARIPDAEAIGISGPLEMDDGRGGRIVIPDVYVAPEGLEEVLVNHDDKLGDGPHVAISLRTIAMFWPKRGTTRRRWWNVPRANGQGFEPGSWNPRTRRPWRLAELIRDLLSWLPGSPSLGRMPTSLELVEPVGGEWTGAESAFDVLVKLTERFSLSPTLDLIPWGSVSFWLDGEGQVGQGPGNERPLEGPGFIEAPRMTAFSYPPRAVRIVGAPTVREVRVDDLEPVGLDLEGRVVRLREALELRGIDVATAAVWALNNEAVQSGVWPKEVVADLRRWAFRWYRVPVDRTGLPIGDRLEVDAEGKPRPPLVIAEDYIELAYSVDEPLPAVEDATVERSQEPVEPELEEQFIEIYDPATGRNIRVSLGQGERVLPEIEEPRRPVIVEPGRPDIDGPLVLPEEVTPPPEIGEPGDIDEAGPDVRAGLREGAIQGGRVGGPLGVLLAIAGYFLQDRSSPPPPNLDGPAGGTGNPYGDPAHFPPELKAARERLDREWRTLAAIRERLNAVDEPTEDDRLTLSAAESRLRAAMRAFERERVSYLGLDEGLPDSGPLTVGPRFVNVPPRPVDPSAYTIDRERGIVQFREPRGILLDPTAQQIDETALLPARVSIVYSREDRPDLSQIRTPRFREPSTRFEYLAVWDGGQAREVSAVAEGREHVTPIPVDRLRLRVRLDGSSNLEQLRAEAATIARGHLTVPRYRHGSAPLLARFAPINCNGLVRAVSWASDGRTAHTAAHASATGRGANISGSRLVNIYGARVAPPGWVGSGPGSRSGRPWRPADQIARRAP